MYLPCTSRSRSRNLNCANAKSEAITACMPSCPEMPTPMCADWIMPTSLAPSPMASVILPLSLTSLVTSAFCSGDTRQHTTEVHPLPSCRNLSARSSSSANESDRPSMTRQVSTPFFEVTASFAMPASMSAATCAFPCSLNCARVISLSCSCLTSSSMFTT